MEKPSAFAIRKLARTAGADVSEQPPGKKWRGPQDDRSHFIFYFCDLRQLLNRCKMCYFKKEKALVAANLHFRTGESGYYQNIVQHEYISRMPEKRGMRCKLTTMPPET